MYVDPNAHTTATLFGNDAAIQALSAAQKGEGRAAAYPTGAVLALVTWTQRDDPHWFGGRIPDAPESVEFVLVSAAGQTNKYRRFAGQGLQEQLPTASAAEMRTSLMLGLGPARLP